MFLNILYGSPLCTDPDWEGTVTEQTNNHLVVHVVFKRCYIFNNLFI